MGFRVVGVRKKQFYMDAVYYDEVMMELFVEKYLQKNSQEI
ncbi:unnamed protein product [marine sediment metagenome]|uniref:N-acetyltransferase domain-containing protein n=1 Tax=marine sediment metagenome TaxID=412755 RepID=X1JEX6_9ZZZZ